MRRSAPNTTSDLVLPSSPSPLALPFSTTSPPDPRTHARTHADTEAHKHIHTYRERRTYNATDRCLFSCSHPFCLHPFSAPRRPEGHQLRVKLSAPHVCNKQPLIFLLPLLPRSRLLSRDYDLRPTGISLLLPTPPSRTSPSP